MEERAREPPLQPASHAAEAIVRDGSRVRWAITDLTLRAYRARGMEIDDLASLVEEVLLGVVSGLSGVPRPRRDALLRQVFEGLADAYASAAAKSRFDRSWDDIEASVSKAVSGFATRAGDELMKDYKAVTEQLREAGERLKPKAKAAMHAIDENVVEPASQAAAQGARTVKRTLGVLLAAAGEVLQELGDTIKEQAPGKPPPATSRRPAAATAPGPSGTTTTRRAKAAPKARPNPARASVKQTPSAKRAAGSTTRSRPASAKKKPRR